MDTITVKKDDLLAKMRENRDNHRAVFEAAQVAFRQRYIEWLDERLQRARENKQARIILVVPLPEPVDYTEQYDEAIERFEWHQGETIELESHEFRQYVLDKWGWEKAFAASTRSYTG